MQEPVANITIKPAKLNITPASVERMHEVASCLHSICTFALLCPCLCSSVQVVDTTMVQCMIIVLDLRASAFQTSVFAARLTI